MASRTQRGTASESTCEEGSPSPTVRTFASGHPLIGEPESSLMLQRIQIAGSGSRILAHSRRYTGPLGRLCPPNGSRFVHRRSIVKGLPRHMKPRQSVKQGDQSLLQCPWAGSGDKAIGITLAQLKGISWEDLGLKVQNLEDVHSVIFHVANDKAQTAPIWQGLRGADAIWQRLCAIVEHTVPHLTEWSKPLD